MTQWTTQTYEEWHNDQHRHMNNGTIDNTDIIMKNGTMDNTDI